MNYRISRVARPGSLMLGALLAIPALGACGGSTGHSTTPSAAAAASQAPATVAATPSHGVQAGATVASLVWPQGTDDFTLNLCTSVGEHTIQGGGDSVSGKWNLVIDANLLAAGDTGTLTVSQKSDMSVIYDAHVTALTVKSDGSFTGSGEDASKAGFTITGICDVAW